jgi:hypothetical protein
MSFIWSVIGHFYSYLTLFLLHCSSSENTTSALNLVLRRKAIGAEALAAQQDAVLSDKYPELQPKLRELKTLRMQISKKTLDGPASGESFIAYQQHLKQLNSQREEVEEYLAHNIPEIKVELKLRAWSIIKHKSKGNQLIKLNKWSF